MNKNDSLALIIQILMAVFGGAARVLNQKDNLHIPVVFGRLFISAFTGMMLYWVSQAMEVDTPWMYAVSGIAGWAGPQVLDGVLNLAQKRTGLPLSGESGKNGENEG